MTREYASDAYATRVGAGFIVVFRRAERTDRENSVRRKDREGEGHCETHRQEAIPYSMKQTVIDWLQLQRRNWFDESRRRQRSAAAATRAVRLSTLRNASGSAPVRRPDIAEERTVQGACQ